MFINTGQMWGMGGGMWFWALIIIGIIYYFSGGYRPRGYRGREASPIEIARKRYARGEITLEEFEAIKKALSG